MAWFKLDDAFHAHPKVEAAGNAAVGLWVRCGVWSAAYGEDGHVTARIARRYGSPRDIAVLTDVGLWVPNGDGYLIHDFLDYNPSAAEVKQRRAETSAVKRAGGLARARRAKRDEHGHFI